MSARTPWPPVLVQVAVVDDHAGVENRGQLVPVCAAKEKLDQLFDLRPRIHLTPVQRGLEVVQLRVTPRA